MRTGSRPNRVPGVSGSIWQGGRGALWVLALVALLAGSSRSWAAAAPAGADSARTAATAAKKCTKAIVNGRHACLRKGDKCKRALPGRLCRRGLSCKHKRLRKASIKQLRGGQPLLLSDNGYLSLKTALAAFDAQDRRPAGREAEAGRGRQADRGHIRGRADRADVDKLGPAAAGSVPAVDDPRAGRAVIIDPRRPPPLTRRGRRALRRRRRRRSSPTPTWTTRPARAQRNHGYFPPKQISLTLLQNQGTVKATDLGYVPTATSSRGVAHLQRVPHPQGPPAERGRQAVRDRPRGRALHAARLLHQHRRPGRGARLGQGGDGRLPRPRR